MIEYTVKVYTNGTTFWYLNGKLHREDGPASEWADGTTYWYLNGEQLTEEQFNSRNTKELTVAEVEKLLGFRVKIIKDH